MGSTRLAAARGRDTPLGGGEWLIQLAADAGSKESDPCQFAAHDSERCGRLQKKSSSYS